MDDDLPSLHRIQSSTLEPLFVFGVKPEVHGGIFFAGDNVNLLYAAGCGVAVYNTKVRWVLMMAILIASFHFLGRCCAYVHM